MRCFKAPWPEWLAALLLATIFTRGGPAQGSDAITAAVLDGAALEAARELFDVGKAAMVANDPARSVRAFDEALALAPLPTIGLALARALEADRQLDRALQQYHAVAMLSWPDRLDPAPQEEAQRLARVEGLLLKARMALTASEYTEATRALEQAMSLSPFPTVGLKLATSLELAGDLKRALEQYRKTAAQPFPDTLATEQQDAQRAARQSARMKAVWLEEKIAFEEAGRLARAEAARLRREPFLLPLARPQPRPQQEPSAWARPLGWAAIGVGGTAVAFNLGAWTYFGMPMPWEDVRCKSTNCGAENTWRRAMSISGLVGLGLGLAGGGLLLYARTAEEQVRGTETATEVGLSLSVGSVSVQGTF